VQEFILGVCKGAQIKKEQLTEKSNKKDSKWQEQLKS